MLAEAIESGTIRSFGGNPAATFGVRISGGSMRDRGMRPGDIAVVDRARQPMSRGVVPVGGGFTIET